MFGLGFVFAAIGAYLIDCAVQGRHPVQTIEAIIQDPSNFRETLSASDHQLTEGDSSTDLSAAGDSSSLGSNSSPAKSSAAGKKVKGGGIDYGVQDSVIPPPGYSGGDGNASGVVAYAEAQIGKPYAWGKTGPNSFDCSGLVYAAYRSVGIKIPRTTAGMLATTRVVKKANLQPGDVIFPYPGHCFLYVGSGQCVEAPHTGTKIRYTNIYAFMTARRFL